MLPILVTDFCTLNGAGNWADKLISGQLFGPTNRRHFQGKSTVVPDMLIEHQHIDPFAVKKNEAFGGRNAATGNICR